MATTPFEHTTATKAAGSDPFRYGWRYVQREQPDGSTITEAVPLTLADRLHPEAGDHVTHSTAHQRRIRYLCDVFAARLAPNPSAVVLDDVRIAWDVPDLKAHGPDIMVIVGVREAQNWSTFDVASEDTRPVLIVEVTSPETRTMDLVTKVDQYNEAEVPLYIIVDTVSVRGQSFLRLVGYQRRGSVYAALPPDERGWLWLAPLEVWLGVRDEEVYCFDAAGTQIGDYVAVTTALAAAEARVAAEQQARADAEARILALEAELARLRGDTA